MRKFSLIVALLATISLPSKLVSQYSEIEVKNMISQASEKRIGRTMFKNASGKLFSLCRFNYRCTF